MTSAGIQLRVVLHPHLMTLFLSLTTLTSPDLVYDLKGLQLG